MKEAASLSSQPRACGSKFVRRKEFYWRAANSRASKSESLYFPARLRHDGNLCDLTAMRNQEIEIIPIRAALPTFKVLSNERARGVSIRLSILSAQCRLVRRKLGLCFKVPLMRSTQMSLGSYSISMGMMVSSYC